MSITFRSVFLLLTLSLSSCQSVYYSAWEKLGVEKRDILVDRVEDARDSQTEAQAEFASALAEFSALINFDDNLRYKNHLSINDDYKGQNMLLLFDYNNDRWE